MSQKDKSVLNSNLTNQLWSNFHFSPAAIQRVQTLILLGMVGFGWVRIYPWDSPSLVKACPKGTKAFDALTKLASVGQAPTLVQLQVFIGSNPWGPPLEGRVRVCTKYNWSNLSLVKASPKGTKAFDVLP
ncbi:hypothetical protein BK120_02235 [Paenibacillus sp. FSL A5-0031]|nr:hypothetical protein BK120_02235 [Paenibacillus sp. FSL A5-0031]